MLIDPRAVALNDALKSSQELADCYRADVERFHSASLHNFVEQRIQQLESHHESLSAAVKALGELPRAPDEEAESLQHLVDLGADLLAEATDGHAGRHLSESFAAHEEQLQQAIREHLDAQLAEPLSCANTDILEAMVVESEKASAILRKS